MSKSPALVAAAMVAAALSIAAPASALERTLTVSGKADIFAAGRGAVPKAIGGALPDEIRLTAGSGRVLSAAGVSGKVGVTGRIDTHCGVVDPDGHGACRASDIESANGISGIVAGDNSAAMLVGVFLTDAAPGATAPPRLDFTQDSGLGQGFLQIAPRIAQTFWIGDGLTGDGSGDRQQIAVPARATRLFLGLADASAFQGSPCCYDDNVGSFKATVRIGPGSATTRSAPAPKPGKRATTGTTTGRVYVIRHGHQVRLRPGQSVPVGSVVDTRRGSIQLKVADGHGGIQAGTFSKGRFRFTQPTEKVVVAGKTRRLRTPHLTLTGGSFKGCAKGGGRKRRAAGARRRSIRYLKAKASSRFRVIGRRSSGIERGTAWTTTDVCDGTITKVTKGSVLVTDLVLHRDILVTAPNSYEARAPARGRR